MLNGAVFFDLDGTLVDGRDGIVNPTKKTIEAITKLKSNHYLVGLATGRAKCYVPKSAFLFDCYVASNGAYAEVNHQAVYNSVIEPSELHRLLSYLDKKKMNYVMENQECCFVKDMEESFYLEMMKNFRMSDENYYPFLSVKPGWDQTINKLMVTYGDETKLQQFMNDFGNLFDITRQPGNPACDVGKKSINKALGIKKVIEFLSLEKNSTYGFGDADNDIEMFRTVGTGIAMGRHTKALEQVSGYITGSVKEEGIYHALVHYGLI